MSNTSQKNTSTDPLIPASTSLPEITVKAVVLSIILTVILAAANAFLGLKVGTTVSASIPAAVISLGILRMFRRNNVLESTMVQTAASVGEGLTAGLAFILPALLILGFWHDFSYLTSLCVGLLGGLLGILYTIPIRRALINSPELRFPEGTAIGNVLKASVGQESADLGMLVKGGLIGGVISLFQSGFQVLTEGVDYWWKVKNSLFGFGLGFSPALIAAGYIVGINVGISLMVGVVIGWIIGVPVLTYVYGLPDLSDPMMAAQQIWGEHIRYVGVGTMLVGGLWTLVKLCGPVISSLKTSLMGMKTAGKDGGEIRTERDIPIKTVLWLLGLILIPTFIFAYLSFNPEMIPVSGVMRVIIAFVSVAYALFMGFVFSSISAYFAGLIGSTNSPGSGLTVSALLVFALLMLAVLSVDAHFLGEVAGVQLAAAGYTILMITILSACIVIANETIQDLKVGQILGATPWKQQVMLVLGVVVSALVVPLILKLLFNAYGMAGVFPHPGMDPKQMLPAPQAGLMAAMAKGAFGHNLPWSMISAGGVVAVVCIIVDTMLKPYRLRLPVLAVGLGIYIPMVATVPMFIGGLVQYLVYRKFNRVRHRAQKKKTLDKKIASNKHMGLTLACGLVAGASLMGVILAIPFSIAQSSDVWRLVGPDFTPIADLLGLGVTFLLCVWMFLRITRLRR